MARVRLLAMAPMTLLATLLPMSSAPIASAPIASGTSVRELSVGGTTRTYRLYVPRSLGRRPAPLIVVLHGGFGTGATALRQGGWVAAARQHEFVAVAPDGLTRSWNAGGCCGPAMRNGVDDVGFVLAMLDEVARLVPIDRTRVFATGLSNGGMMAYRLGCEASDRFAAIAPVAATLITPGCAPTEPVSLLHIHGLVDGNVPFEGGLPTRSFQVNPPSYPPVREGIDRFVRADRCRTMPRTTEHGVVRTQRWRGGDRGADVELITIADGGHSWPGGMQMAAVLDPPSGAVDATEKIWRFFAAHPRR